MQITTMIFTILIWITLCAMNGSIVKLNANISAVLANELRKP